MEDKNKPQEKTKIEDTSAMELEESQSEAAAGGLIVECNNHFRVYSNDGRDIIAYTTSLDDATKIAQKNSASIKVMSYEEFNKRKKQLEQDNPIF